MRNNKETYLRQLGRFMRKNILNCLTVSLEDINTNNSIVVFRIGTTNDLIILMILQPSLPNLHSTYFEFQEL